MRLRRLHEYGAKPYAVFEKDEPDKKIHDFSQIKFKIEELTDKVCGKSKGIIDNPIVLNIFSPHCPDMTLIDLPGITVIAQAGQDQNIEQVTKQMAARYCGDERTIILCVIPANQDMSTSVGLQMARDLDKKGERTIGVITKIDIMDRGTNAKKMILNEEIPLKMGYVGVKGRSQADVQDGMKVNEAIQEEKNYFARHPVYSHLPPGYLGTETLTNKLTTIMYRHIKKHMPSIIAEIDSKIYECERSSKDLGTPLPQEDSEKMLMVWRLISDFALKVKTSISGEYSPDMHTKKKDMLGGLRIKMKFNDLFIKQMSLSYKASAKFSDNDIKAALRLHMNNTLPGFTSSEAFLSLINPLLVGLKDPAMTMLEEVHAIMEQICIYFINETFQRFPMFISEITDATLNILSQDKERAKLLVGEIIEANIGYTYTKDPEYISVILPQSEKEKIEKQKDIEKKQAEEKAKEAKKEEERLKAEGKDSKGGDAASKPQTNSKSLASKDIPDDDDMDEDPKNLKLNKNKAQKAMEKKLLKEMRVRINTYFRVVVTQLADIVPKIIGHNLVNSALSNLQFSVYKRVSNGPIFDLLKEPEHIISKRETMKKILEVLRNSRKILLRDPDLAFSMDLKDSSNMMEMREKDKLRKQTAAEERKKTMLEKASEAASKYGNKIKTAFDDAKTSVTSSAKPSTSSPTSKPVTSSPVSKPAPSKPREMNAQETLAKEGAKLAYENKDTIIKVAKENPELAEKAVKAGANAAKDGDKKKNVSSLFGYL